MSVTVEKYVELDVDVEDIDTDELAEELLSRTGWYEALREALAERDLGLPSPLIHELVDAWVHRREQFEGVLRDFAWRFAGRVI